MPDALRLRVLLNAGGGTIRRLGPEATRDRVTAAFEASGAEVDVVLARGDELGRLAEEARAEALFGRLDGVVVGGGDGSVGTVAGVLVGSGVAMAVLPLGTLNHFAKDLGMPLDLEEAAAAIVAAHARSVDAAEVNGRIFVNNSLIGVYPYMVMERERRRSRHGLGKWPAMGLALARMLRHFPRRRLEVCVAGGAKPYRTPLLFVGNNEYGFGLFTVERRRLDAGELWLTVAKPHGPFGLLWLAIQAMLGRVDRVRDLDVLRAPAAEIVTRASRLPVSTDGEVVRMRPPLRYRTRPGALRVLAPPRRQAGAE